MRALLVVLALLLAAAPAVARPRHAPPAKPRCAHAAGKHKPRVCARLHRGRIHRAARALATFSFPPAPAVAPPAVTPAPVPSVTPASTPEPPSLPPVYSNPFAVQVQAFEYGLLLSKGTVSAGKVRVEFNLARAEDPHNLFLVRADGTGPAYSFDEQPSGAVVAQSFSLTRGKWTLFCTLPEHEAKGMRATLTVSG